MTDLELINLASKASGFEYTANDNPLVSDALALRLAVKLNLFIDLCYPDKTCGWVGDYKSGVCKTLEEPENNDPYAATRRAIVRAAAEIGRGME